MYTDPNDQSVWIYHRWLIGSGLSPPNFIPTLFHNGILGDDRAILDREIEVIKELLEEQPDSKCMFLSSTC